MSLIVVDNLDGTYTVSCGDETRTIGKPFEFVGSTAKTKTVRMIVPDRDTPSNYYPKTIPKNTGATVTEVDTGLDPFTTVHLCAKSMEDFNRVFESDVRPLANSLKPVELSMIWEGASEPDTHHILRVLQSVTDKSFVTCQVHTPLKKAF